MRTLQYKDGIQGICYSMERSWAAQNEHRICATDRQQETSGYVQGETYHGSCLYQYSHKKYVRWKEEQYRIRRSLFARLCFHSNIIGIDLATYSMNVQLQWSIHQLSLITLKEIEYTINRTAIYYKIIISPQSNLIKKDGISWILRYDVSSVQHVALLILQKIPQGQGSHT